MPNANVESAKPDSETTELTFAELNEVSGGRIRMVAQLNSGEVNPIVISRDRALNS